jgi:glycosyltransferase involved in cell wall biosynthesis
LGWSTIKKVIGNARFESFHLHWTRDLNPDLTDLPSAEDEARFPIQKSSWFNSPSEYANYVRQTNVYFAPRTTEGIGMSYLEALSWGLCVVAPDAPTMNEYIVNGVNGILYDPNKPVPLDFSNHQALGRAAREACAGGRRAWEAAFGDIKRFLETPLSSFAMPSHPLISMKKRGYAALRSVYRIGKRLIKGMRGNA